MDREPLLDAARQALSREGIDDAPEDFSLACVDDVTRWVAAVAIESAAKTKLADADIVAAATLGGLVDLATD